ncbi:hypothetical protein [Gemmatimonas sp.]
MSAALEEVTELAALQPTFRDLIHQAFALRLGNVEPAFDFHRGWNGGWRCRATIPGKVPLDFALLRTSAGALLAFPVPLPTGWRRRGIQDSAGVTWTVDDQGMPIRLR